MNHRVFVYGTLKQGFPNHHLNRGRRIEGRFSTREAYPLLLVGERHSPWLIDRPGEGFRISGELYLLDEEGLREMDRLERIDADDGYRRQEREILDEDQGTVLRAFIYLKPAASLDKLEEGRIRSGPHAVYDGELAARYRPRSP